jgi:transposase InsO family protein
LAPRDARHPARLHSAANATPQWQVERSRRVDDQEFYQLLDKDGITDDIRLFNEKLREWEDYYNYHRPHGALEGQTPYERLLAKNRAEV